jgi:Glycosyl transferase family 2
VATQPGPEAAAPLFHVVAIISTFNEADIIGPVLDHLGSNRVSSYLIDNGSTDETVARAQEWLGRGLLGIERMPPGDGGRVSWRAILARKLELSRELGADWYMHHDADEVRESPWPGVSLQEAIWRVDRLGYNAIDFRVLNFPPVDDTFRPGHDPREHFTRWEDPAEYDRLQRKAWKAGFPDVSLEDGGHDVRFAERRLFPLRFLLRHYPIRSQAHGTRKVLRERKERFTPDETAMGWHRQYGHVQDVDHLFLKNPALLQPFDLDRIRLETMLEDARTSSPPADDGRTPAHPPVRGFLEQATPTRVSGWAAREDGDGDPLTVELWDGGRPIATVVADRPREDLERHGIAGGRAGFVVRTPPQLLDGRPHWIWATVRDSGVALTRSPLVLCSPSRPTTPGEGDPAERPAIA